MVKFRAGIITRLVIVLILLGGIFTVPVSAQPAVGNGGSQSVIVQGTDIDQVITAVTEHGGTVTSRLDIINGVGALVPTGEIENLKKAPGITNVTINASTHLTAQSFEKKANSTSPATDYPDVTGADLVWDEQVTGEGVSVAILDTGISRHPGLLTDSNQRDKDRVVAWADFVEGKKKPVDPNGHGTHIAGVIANASIGADGEFNGMAPDVNLVIGRVLDETGAGDYEKVIQGIDWVVKNKEKYQIKVLNLSLYSLVQSPYWADPLNQAVMAAWADGITVVVAAGNSGPNPMTIAVPGNVPYVITVGAFTDNYTPNDWNDDYVAPFSSAGPTLDAFVKPDLLAPGAHITSTMLPGSYIARNHEANWVDKNYFSMAGTSQAAAVVSGVASLVLSENNNLTPDEVKYRLVVTSLPWINVEQTDVLYSVWQQGAGRVNAYDAVMSDDITGTANSGLDIVADITGTQHFEGYSYFDETTGLFRLHGYEADTSSYGSWAGSYGSWAGSYGSWAGSYGSWAGSYGSWAGSYGSWAGSYGSWAGGYGSWAGSYGSWAGGYGSWAGGYGSWAGAYGSWAGGYGSWAGYYYEPTFFENFMNGVSPDDITTTATLHWVDEQ